MIEDPHERTIAKLALQALLGRRRFWLLLAFPILLIGLVGLVTGLTDADAAYSIVPDLGYPLVLPLVAILAASSVLGPEVDDGSIVYLLSKPVSRYGVAISKWVVALGATLAAGALPLFVAGLLTDDTTRAVALAWPRRWPGRRTPRSSSRSPPSPGTRWWPR